MIILTYLPAFITIVFRGMPSVWKSQHRLMLCWVIVMQALYPGRKTLEGLARWSPASITSWRLNYRECSGHTRQNEHKYVRSSCQQTNHVDLVPGWMHLEPEHMFVISNQGRLN
jgi:hypothetical protein